MSSYETVTFLENLPPMVEQSDRQSNRQSERQIRERFIRNDHRLDAHSGMGQMDIYHRREQYEHTPSPPPQPPVAATCMDMLQHSKDCPLCRRMYAQDNTVYLIIIALLTIFCILLLKKVLNI